MAMNGRAMPNRRGGSTPERVPAFTVDLADGPRHVTGGATQGAERERLGARWWQIDKHLEAYAARRSMHTAEWSVSPAP
jgi:hypothetical protein